IAAHRMKPMVIKPLNYVFAFRTSVHQVANREKPVLRFIETNSIKLCPQLGKAAMDITYCNVSAFLVDDESFNEFAHALTSPQPPDNKHTAQPTAQQPAAPRGSRRRSPRIR